MTALEQKRRRVSIQGQVRRQDPEPQETAWRDRADGSPVPPAEGSTVGRGRSSGRRAALPYTEDRTDAGMSPESSPSLRATHIRTEG